MANQLKKKFIGDDQVDGVKILLGVGQTLRKDNGVGGFIDVIGQLEGADATEASTRQSADTTLQNNINTVSGNLATEVSNRSAADTTLQTNIDNEATTRSNADIALQGNIDLKINLSEKGAINGVATLDANGLVPANQLPSYVDDVLEFANVAAFPATGESGKIYVDIATNKTYRWSGSVYIYITSGAVDSVNNKTGVVVLDTSDIKMLDGTTSVETKLNSLQTAINNEAITRAQADSDIDGRLDLIEAVAHGKFKKALIAGDITNGYVDLPHLIKPNSLVACVDRLAIHEGASEDYTISEVGGVSRITFLNSLVSPGNESLTAGDNLYFKYMY